MLHYCLSVSVLKLSPLAKHDIDWMHDGERNLKT